METCKDCKWWFAPHYKKEFGECSKLLRKYGFHNQWKGDPKKSLTTDPDFGCIHWEKKE